jgi:hypothetical protein
LTNFSIPNACFCYYIILWSFLSLFHHRIFHGVDYFIRKGVPRAGHWWLTPVILTTQEAEIRRIVVQSQPRQIVLETLSQKNPLQKRTGGVAQGAGPEFKPQCCKKFKKI